MTSLLKKQKEVEAIKRVANNTIALLGGRICEVIFGILSMAIITRYLGLSLYGKYAFITSTVSVVIILSYFGLQQILIREIAQDKSKTGLYFGIALIVRGLLSLFVIIAVLLLAHIVNLSPLEQKALYVCTLSEILISFSMLFKSIFNAQEKMVYDALFTFMDRLASLIAICIVVWINGSFLALFLAIAAANLVSLCITGTFLIVKKGVKPQFIYDVSLIKYFFIQSFPLGLGNILRVYAIRIDVFILIAFKSAQDVALFFGPYNIIMRLQMLPLSFSLALFPMFSRLSMYSEASFKNTFMKAFKILIAIGVFINITIFYWANEIVLLLFGSEFVKASLVLRILSFVTGLMFIESILMHALIAQKKQWMTIFSNGATFLVNLVFDLILVPHYGYIGAAIATSIAYVSRFIISCIFVNKYVFPLPLGKLIIKPLCAGILVGGLLWALGNTNHFLAFTLGAIIYIWFLWVSNFFEKQEIKMFGKVFSGMLYKRIEGIK